MASVFLCFLSAKKADFLIKLRAKWGDIKRKSGVRRGGGTEIGFSALKNHTKMFAKQVILRTDETYGSSVLSQNYLVLSKGFFVVDTKRRLRLTAGTIDR